MDSLRFTLKTGNKKAGDGNRTHVSSLEGWCSTIELHPRICSFLMFINHEQILLYTFYFKSQQLFSFFQIFSFSRGIHFALHV